MLPPDAQAGLDGFYYFVVDPPPGKPRSTIDITEAYDVDVKDLRAFATLDEQKEAGFHLEEAGFEVVHGFASGEQTRRAIGTKCRDQSWVKGAYYQDTVQLVKDRLREGLRPTDELTIAVVSHRLRCRDPSLDQPIRNIGMGEQLQPVKRVHCDQTNEEGLFLVERHFGADVANQVRDAQASQSTSIRCRIINVWRPTRDNLANDWPLALMDARTLRASDLVEASYHDVVDRGYGFFAVKYRPVATSAPGINGNGLSAIEEDQGQSFWYCSQQTIDEAILINCWDSSTVHTKCAHVAFEHPGTGQEVEQNQLRSSLEVRLLIMIRSVERE